MWHVWVKSFRERNNLTQDEAAEMLCVDVRTIRRWEAGSYPSSSHVTRFEHVLMPSRDHRLIAHIKPLLELTGDVMIAFDENYRVLGQSRAHKEHMFKLWGVDDVSGVSWMESKYAPEQIRNALKKAGDSGASYFRKGIVSLRFPFMHERDGVIINGGRSDSSFLRLADGNVILSVTHKNTDPSFIDDYVRPYLTKGVYAIPDGVTTLDH